MPNKFICNPLLQLLEKRADIHELQQEKERMTKLPPHILLDYIKRLVYQIFNENEELKVNAEKVVLANLGTNFDSYEDQEILR